LKSQCGQASLYLWSDGKTLHKEYQKTTTNDTRRQFSMIHEYPLDGNRPWWRTCLKIRKANELLLQRRSRNDYKSIQPKYGGTATNSRYN
jgi:hypothetical protein